MTEEQEALLQRLSDQSDRMHRAFMEPSETGDAPLIHQIGEMSKAWQRGKWGLRVFVYGLPALAACGAAVQWFVRTFGKGGAG